MKVVLTDGPAAGWLVEVGPLQRVVTVSLGTERLEGRRYGDVTVTVDRHVGLATYRLDLATNAWLHVKPTHAIGDVVGDVRGEER